MSHIDTLQERLDGGECAVVPDGKNEAKPGSATAVRARVVDELRRLLPCLSEAAGPPRALSFGMDELDSRLHQGGLAFGVLHELVPASDGDTPAALGFMMALLGRLPRTETMLFVSPKRWLARYGQPYGHGLNALGLDPSRVIFTRAAEV